MRTLHPDHLCLPISVPPCLSGQCSFPLPYCLCLSLFCSLIVSLSHLYLFLCLSPRLSSLPLEISGSEGLWLSLDFSLCVYLPICLFLSLSSSVSVVISNPHSPGNGGVIQASPLLTPTPESFALSGSASSDTVALIGRTSCPGEGTGWAGWGVIGSVARPHQVLLGSTTLQDPVTSIWEKPSLVIFSLLPTFFPATHFLSEPSSLCTPPSPTAHILPCSHFYPKAHISAAYFLPTAHLLLASLLDLSHH